MDRQGPGASAHVTSSKNNDFTCTLEEKSCHSPSLPPPPPIPSLNPSYLFPPQSHDFFSSGERLQWHSWWRRSALRHFAWSMWLLFINRPNHPAMSKLEYSFSSLWRILSLIQLGVQFDDFSIMLSHNLSYPCSAWAVDVSLIIPRWSPLQVNTSVHVLPHGMDQSAGTLWGFPLLASVCTTGGSKMSQPLVDKPALHQ